jgi:acyl-CoA synthetase (AMP-forming)/AMP-acid ligase II
MARLIGRILDLAANATPNALAASFGDRVVTFAEADRAANRLARALLELGVRRGDRVIVWCDASLRAFDLFFATQRIGAVFAPINPEFSLDEALACILYAQPRLLIADPRHAMMAEAAAQRAGVDLATFAGGSVTPGRDLEEAARRASGDAIVQEIDEEDIHAMFFTSGSTGQPKGVMLSHRASFIRSYQGNSRSEVSGGAGEVCTFPFFHWAGWNYMLASWEHRRPLHVPTRLDGDAILSEVESWRASILYCIPALWERVLATDRRFDSSSLRYTFTGTSRIDPVLIARIRDRFPVAQFGVLYVSTEFGLGLGIADADIGRKPGSVGLPPPGKEARIVDGELQLRSDSMMSGYFELP